MVQAKEPRKISPDELTALWQIVNEHPSSAPKEVHRIVEATVFVIAAANQTAARPALNRRFSQLRADNVGIFPAVLAWLKEDSTRELFVANGYPEWFIATDYPGARRRLIAVVERIINGDMPHAAFGMDQNKGAPPLWGFTVAEDAAAYAQHLHLNKGENIADAKESAAKLFKTGRRDINRVKIPALTPDEAREWAEHAFVKYGIAL